MNEKITKEAIESAMLHYLKESVITETPAMMIIQHGVENAVAKWLDENRELVLRALANQK